MDPSRTAATGPPKKAYTVTTHRDR
jgi:hypothetical protein